MLVLDLSIIGKEVRYQRRSWLEENAHIEAYHGTLKRDIFDRVDYRTFGEIQQIIKRYVPFYNSERLHGLLGRITPNENWKQDLDIPDHVDPLKSGPENKVFPA